jgi:hypothetical protein
VFCQESLSLASRTVALLEARARNPGGAGYADYFQPDDDNDSQLALADTEVGRERGPRSARGIFSLVYRRGHA